MDVYETLAHLLAEPARTPRSSLGEVDYRPHHGKPGASDIDRELNEPDIDDARFVYPVGNLKRAGRSQHTPRP